MEKVTGILAKKQPHFQRISPSVSIQDALSRMSTQKTDYLIVMDDNGRFLGLLSEHDIATQSIFARQSLAKTKVSEMMNTRLPVAEIHDTLEHCMVLMRRHHIRYLPVFDSLEFCGVLTIDDILEEAVRRGKGIFDKEPEVV
jgi:signal-transduction protein with cAMP-binding, CBS, and nucleotidyltransferase domain